MRFCPLMLDTRYWMLDDAIRIFIHRARFILSPIRILKPACPATCPAKLDGAKKEAQRAKKGDPRPYLALFGCLLSLHPRLIDQNTDDGPDDIGDPIKNVGFSKRHEILVNFVNDSVQGCGHNAQQYKQTQVMSYGQRLIGSLKKNGQNRIGCNMQHFIHKSERREVFR